MIAKLAFLEKKAHMLAHRIVPAPFLADGDPFHFCWITECPEDAVLRIRNSPHVLKMTIDSDPITPYTHRSFIDGYAHSPRFDLMIVADPIGSCIGGINLCWRENGLEIGKYIGDSRYLGRGVAKAAMFSFLDLLRREFPGADLLARTRKENQGNIALNLKLGFVLREDLEGGFMLMHMRLV
jgi:RimJ/RimL family protein N-acetyltransferase